MTANIAKHHRAPSGHGRVRGGRLGVRLADTNPVGVGHQADPAEDALRVTPERTRRSTRPINRARPPLPPKDVPRQLRAAITAAYRRRAALASAAALRRERLGPMWELTTTLCGAVPELAGETGEVALRLCDLPADATAEQVWERVRSAARADMWEYSHEHHQCVRIGDWRPLWP